MTSGVNERNRLALLGWLATVAMSLSFITAVQQSSYVAWGALTSLALVLAGIGLRALRTPTPLVLVAQLVLLAELLLWGFGDDLVAGVIPTRDTWSGIDAVLTEGVRTANDYAAPAPHDPGLLLMLVFFIGVIAVLVDLAIAVDRVPLAGLPLLALYTVPVAALPDGVPLVSFLIGAAAFVGLLTAAERDRLGHWGRLVAHGSVAHSDDAMDTRALRSSGQRIAVLSLATAVVVPIFIPTLSASLFDNGGGIGSGSGSGGNVSFNDPMVSLASALRRDEEVAYLDVTSDIPPSYLRLTVVDQPGPNAWTTGTFDLGDTIPVQSVLPGPTGLSSDVTRTPHSLAVRPTEEFPSNSAWFPVPFNASTVALPSEDWAYFAEDQTVVARNGTAVSRVDEASISYSTIDPTPEQIARAGDADAEIQEQWGGVPDDVPAILTNQARVITTGAANDYERAVLLQSYFRDPENFTYDLDASYGYGYQAMVEFLDKRRGFCQHFSATFAMMARTLGIPSRVVVGFLNPTRSNGDDHVFTSYDLHAWPELYFEGIGWVRFEPTPNVGAALPRWAPDADPSIGPTENPTLPNATTDELPDRPTATDNTTEAAAGADTASGSSGPSAPSPWWLLPPVLVALSLAPALLRRTIRRQRLSRPLDDAAAAEAAWLELTDHMHDLRMPWTGSMTPRARERTIAPSLSDDEARAALRRLAMCVERARYAATPMPDAHPAQDAVMVMDDVSHGVGRRQRLLAWWWPASLMPDLHRAWARLRSGRPPRGEAGPAPESAGP